jgi:hypothetical protein
VIGAVREPDGLQLGQRRSAVLAGRSVAVNEGQLDVGKRAHPRHQVELLEHEADLRVPDPGQCIVVEL